MEEYLGTIQTFGFDFAPRGWALCNGQLLAISNNTALFSLLGTTFGGDGRTTFGLPDLRGRSMVHIGNGPGLNTVFWGESDGVNQVSLNISNMPSHIHSLIDGLANVSTHTTIQTASNGSTNEPDTGNNVFGSGGAFPNIYSEPPLSQDSIGGVSSVTQISGNTSPTGGNIPLNIQNPYIGIYMCIAIEGIYPSRG
ncbi:phage tail protein [Flavobacterium sp. LaA7.5]|nr:phage tail protein [Flavobacterium salilacus subsp. altitudinum]